MEDLSSVNARDCGDCLKSSPTSSLQYDSISFCLEKDQFLCSSRPYRGPHRSTKPVPIFSISSMDRYSNTSSGKLRRRVYMDHQRINALGLACQRRTIIFDQGKHWSYTGRPSAGCQLFPNTWYLCMGLLVDVLERFTAIAYHSLVETTLDIFNYQLDPANNPEAS